MLAGEIPMSLLVTDVDELLIHCGGPQGWKFDRETGMEVDEDIGWGPHFGITGSYLVPPGDSDVLPASSVDDLSPDGPVSDLVEFTTATGSHYEIDNVNLSWRRTPTLASGRLRSESGKLLQPVEPEIGLPVVLVGEPFADGLGPRLVVTSAVVAVNRFVSCNMKHVDGVEIFN
jgi:hypothetical protein